VVQQGGQWNAFEQPLNERVRMFLRLEFLFAQQRHHRGDRSVWGARASLHCLLDILSLVGRTDLKSEIIKELSDQHAALSRLVTRDGVDHDRLKSVLAEIDSAMNAMQTLTSQFVSGALRDNEFLQTVINRASIPGGTCGFDVPLLHHWLSQSQEQVRRDVDAWFADLRPFEESIGLYLRLLRASTEPTEHKAPAGMFVHSPPSAFQLVRVLIPADTGLYPEISAGRHRFSIRFMTCRDVNQRPSQFTSDVTFKLHCCAL
jgi:cell division protein ZapD